MKDENNFHSGNRVETEFIGYFIDLGNFAERCFFMLKVVSPHWLNSWSHAVIMPVGLFWGLLQATGGIKAKRSS